MLFLRNLSFAALLVALVFPLQTANAQSGDAKRAITNIAGDLYRFQNNFHYSVFLVTPEGVIVTDPINAEAAAWLRDEIKARFNQPIKYLVYSHDHRDHAAGGEVFADAGAIVVAHENAKRAIIGEGRPTAVPDVTFTDRMTLELGGKTVELMYLGKSHSDNLIVMNFPAERTLFTVDFISVKRLPFKGLSDAYIPRLDRTPSTGFRTSTSTSWRRVTDRSGTKQDAADHGRYFQELYDAVLAATRAGQSLEEMKTSIKMEAYKDWGQHAGLAASEHRRRLQSDQPAAPGQLISAGRRL